MPRQQQRTTIRVGQRLIRWDGVRGHVDLNSRGVRSWESSQAFQVCWDDGESEYLSLEQFEAEGVRWGRSLMPWAR